MDVMLAAQAGVSTVPWIEADRRLDAEAARALAQRMAGQVNSLAVRMLIPRFAIRGYQPEARRAFRAAGLDLWQVMTVDEWEAEFGRGFVPDRDERIVLEGPSSRITEILAATSSIMPSYRLIPAEARP